ncbi:hypothetical protein [Mycoplana sp. MJR14]|uniref:tetratricopeptide repeat protein n=1 Tax=Mycoplana sp. MJR14 TaxID=3032583 RepID=UPI0023DAFBF8|nr:hypothetical protein [Mycoplana sp. MJR14]MDF1631546.1 hypothetical protein [Mycoplana sp. MJR14]
MINISGEEIEMMDVSDVDKHFYSSAHHQAIWKNCGTDLIVVAFSERKEPAPAEFFAREFFEKERLSYVVVRTLKNTWYLQDDMGELLSAIRLKISESGAKRVVLFGASMGSFGCIRSVNALRPERIIICGPIASLDAKFERRWLSDYRELLPSYEGICQEILPFRQATDVIAIYDPRDMDARHVELVEKHAAVQQIKIAGAGHMVLQYLRDSGVLGKVIRLMLEENVKIEDVKAVIARSRKENKSYLLNLSEKLDRRPRLQRAVLDFAGLRFPEDIAVKLAKSAYHARQKNLEEAAQIILDVVSSQGRRSLGVELGKAISSFAANGGEGTRINSAIKLFAAATPRSRGTQLWYARFLRFSGAYDQAFAAHEQFMGGDTFEAHAHIERGLIFEKMGLNYAAREAFRQALHYAPEFPPANQHFTRVKHMLEKRGVVDRS